MRPLAPEVRASREAARLAAPRRSPGPAPGYIIGCSSRDRVLAALVAGPLTMREIQDRVGPRVGVSVSPALRRLELIGLVTVITESRPFRYRMAT